MLGPIQFHLLSCEGSDAYARAGGVATRVSGLAQALTEANFDTHRWFIGDPALPGHETQGSLHRHRWCQWSSHYHPAGVYDGEEGKRLDDARSLPPFLLREMLWSHLQQGGRAVILALETEDPQEFLGLFAALRAHPSQERALRRAGRLTARQYAWPQVVPHSLLPRLVRHATSALASNLWRRQGSRGPGRRASVPIPKTWQIARFLTRC